MKKLIVNLLTVIVVCGIAAVAFGQGQVNFQNYNFGATSLNAPVTMGGVGLGKEFSADLLYSLDGGITYNLLTAAQANDGTAYPTPFAFGVGNDGDSANFAGYFFGNSVQIPGYTSGPISFIVEAYHGASYAAADLKGQSAVFTMPSITVVGGTALPSDFAGMQGFDLAPEPSMFTLGGLAAAGLLAFRRRKQIGGNGI